MQKDQDHQQKLAQLRTVLRDLQRLSEDSHEQSLPPPPHPLPAGLSGLAMPSPSTTQLTPIANQATPSLVVADAVGSSPIRRPLRRHGMMKATLGGLSAVAAAGIYYGMQSNNWPWPPEVNQDPLATTSTTPVPVASGGPGLASGKIKDGNGSTVAAVETGPTTAAQRSLQSETGHVLSLPDARGVDQLPTVEAVVSAATRLIRNGQIEAARTLLLAHGDRASVDIAWNLARSYDRNFLSEIKNADAEADAGAAERWYRVWHSLAIKQGLVTEQAPIERLIKGLR